MYSVNGPRIGFVTGKSFPGDTKRSLQTFESTIGTMARRTDRAIAALSAKGGPSTSQDQNRDFGAMSKIPANVPRFLSKIRDQRTKVTLVIV
jgi:hypothetical protein